MWSNVVSVDKKFGKEFDFLIEKLSQMKNISFAIEESSSRKFVYLASICEKQEEVEAQLFDVLYTEFLSFFKLRFILDRLHQTSFSFANCSLICSLLHFDREYEKTTVQKVLSECLDYNLDGLLTFRMGALTDNWEELCSVASHLIETSGGEEEMYDIATFITGTEDNRSRLTISKNKIFNQTRRHNVEVVKLFDDDRWNFISAIIEQHPTEIALENCNFSREMETTLRHLARVVAI
ncbi:MAG: hypothetical protein RSA24_00955 [Clostridia bacterium]